MRKNKPNVRAMTGTFEQRELGVAGNETPHVEHSSKSNQNKYRGNLQISKQGKAMWSDNA